MNYETLIPDLKICVKSYLFHKNSFTFKFFAESSENACSDSSDSSDVQVELYF